MSDAARHLPQERRPPEIISGPACESVAASRLEVVVQCPRDAGDLRKKVMAKGKKAGKNAATGRAVRVKLTPEESLKRMQEFSKRKERFVAAVRGSCR
jgi:hypothetical protein